MGRVELKTAAIILAAGESRRMGQPKALLPFRGGTFLSVLAETLAVCGDRIFAVFGFQAEQLMKRAPGSVVAVENPNYREGMLTSLQAGLRAIGQLPDRILFTLVDHPAIARETVVKLLETEAPIVIPRYAGKRGHPVLIRREIAQEILAEPSTSKLNIVMDRHAGEIHYIDTNDSGVRDDIDDPHLYHDLLVREGARV